MAGARSLEPPAASEFGSCKRSLETPNLGHSNVGVVPRVDSPTASPQRPQASATARFQSAVHPARSPTASPPRARCTRRPARDSRNLDHREGSERGSPGAQPNRQRGRLRARARVSVRAPPRAPELVWQLRSEHTSSKLCWGHDKGKTQVTVPMLKVCNAAEYCCKLLCTQDEEMPRPVVTSLNNFLQRELLQAARLLQRARQDLESLVAHLEGPLLGPS